MMTSIPSTQTTYFEETVFLKGDDYFQALLADVKQAQHSIELETYIFKNDKLGREIADALIAAAKRGIKIRLLVDSAGTPNWGNTLTRRMERAGIKTRVFHPFPWRVWQWRRSANRSLLLIRVLYFLFKVNSRNHRKVCIIDQQTAYVGSVNIAKCHLGLEGGGDGWRDTGIRIKTTDLKELIDAFEAVWEQKDIQERIREIFARVNKNPTFRLNNSRHRRRILYKNLLKRIKRCRERIWITNSYFVPDNFLLRHLRQAAELGVDVRILLPRKSDIFIMPWAATTFYQSLLRAGVRIFEYKPAILHAKTLILDDWFIVGSSNLNHRSLFHDLEVDVNVRLETSKQLIEAQFLQDLEQAHEIKLDNWAQRPFYQRFIGRLSLYAKYWI